MMRASQLRMPNVPPWPKRFLFRSARKQVLWTRSAASALFVVNLAAIRRISGTNSTSRAENSSLDASSFFMVSPVPFRYPGSRFGGYERVHTFVGFPRGFPEGRRPWTARAACDTMPTVGGVDAEVLRAITLFRGLDGGS